jgi:aspartate aminotransferase-like enzyme
MSKQSQHFLVKNYIVGPVSEFERTIAIRARNYPYFRASQFSEINKFIIKSLETLLGVPSNYQTALITGSGTLGMEICATNFTSVGDRVLVISSGSFGDRFSDILTRLGCKVEVVKVNFDQNLCKSDLLKLKDPQKFKGVFVNHHETSTGHLHNLKILRNFCNKNSLFLVADCMTSFLSDEPVEDIAECDVVITSSHKGMCCSPGLVFITYKKTLLKHKLKRQNVSSYVDLNSYTMCSTTGQPPYTPAVGVILELQDMFNFINSIGYVKWTQEIAKRATVFRQEIQREWNIPEHRLSNFMTPILLPSKSKVVLNKLIEDLREQHGVEVTPISGQNSQRMLRISHVGNHTIAETLKLAISLNEGINKNV